MRHLLHVLRYALRRPRIALLGMQEFRSCWTTHFDDDDEALESYDAGRELAHMLTLRRWDD
jgi:hypothetical protein